MKKKPEAKPAIVLFDGYCNLCSGSVQFIIKRDPEARFSFASLQSDSGKKVLRHFGLDAGKFDSVVLVENDSVYAKSTAALRIAGKLQGLWSLTSVFLIVPRGVRDWIYDWIARNRYRWFGKKRECWLPSPELKSRFLEEEEKGKREKDKG